MYYFFSITSEVGLNWAVILGFSCAGLIWKAGRIFSINGVVCCLSLDKIHSCRKREFPELWSCYWHSCLCDRGAERSQRQWCESPPPRAPSGNWNKVTKSSFHLTGEIQGGFPQNQGQVHNCDWNSGFWKNSEFETSLQRCECFYTLGFFFPLKVPLCGIFGLFCLFTLFEDKRPNMELIKASNNLLLCLSMGKMLYCRQRAYFLTAVPVSAKYVH